MVASVSNFIPSGPPVIARLNSRSSSLSPRAWPSTLTTGSQQVIAALQRKSLTFFNLSATATVYICPAQDQNGNPLAAAVNGPGCIAIPAGAGMTLYEAASAFNACASVGGTPFTVWEFLEGEVAAALTFAVGSSTPVTTNLENDGGWLVVLSAAAWPTAPGALPAGSLWSNGNLATVIPGITPNPAAPPVFFSGLTAAALLALGGGNLPLSLSGVVSGQLWNNGGVVSIA